MTVIVPLLVPGRVGMNETLILQLAPAARLEPQVLVLEKSPLIAMLLTVRMPLPELVSCIDWGGLMAPRFVAGKVSAAGVSVTAGPIPVPLRSIV